jgi:hypothetical protein
VFVVAIRQSSVVWALWCCYLWVPGGEESYCGVCAEL